MKMNELMIYQVFPLRALTDGQPSHGILEMIDWIPHIKKLGMNAVYFSPVFSSSDHGYDTKDYQKIDERLGTNEDFKKMCDAMHEEGIQVILDGVFNHVGREFFAFEDVREKKWDSPYKDWFYINFDGNSCYDDGFWYEGWEGHFELVKLNLDNEQVRNYLLESVGMWIDKLGIDGENEFVERKEKADIIYRLGFSKCRLSLAVHKEEEYNGPSWFNGKKIATSYPGILQTYLDKQGINADIHVITGSVEIAPGIGLSDAIFDIVSSGSTLISNNLKEVEIVMKSEALLIGNPNLTPEKKEILEELLFRIEAVKAAEDKKYVLMNAPTDKVKDIIEVLPGVKSPTIMPLATEGWSSVHTVIDQKCFWEIIGKLKALGAQGILVLPIEKMIL